MAVVSMKALLESGVHFGHRTNKWNPGMRPYIFTERNGIHIIDLQQTVKAINTAYNIIRDAVANGGVVMFVGTKRQAQDTVREEAMRCGMPYVTERWLGGMLTNWSTMHQRIQELERMEKLFTTGEIENLTKKEALLIQREINRLNVHLSGVRNMTRVPDLLFVVDVDREYLPVHEANLLGIPVIALVDTNCDPSNVDYVIPSNDDAIRAIKLLVAKMADAVEEGKAMRKDKELEADIATKPATEAEVEAALKSAHAMDTEVDMEDNELLGASTLAKMSTAPKEETSETAVAPEETAKEQTDEPTVEPTVEPTEDQEQPKE